MPEPDYLGGEPPGWLWVLIGIVFVAIFLIVIKACG